MEGGLLSACAAGLAKWPATETLAQHDRSVPRASRKGLPSSASRTTFPIPQRRKTQQKEKGPDFRERFRNDQKCSSPLKSS